MKTRLASDAEVKRYLAGFRTRVCPEWREAGDKTTHSAADCFDCHSATPSRRPAIDTNGRSLYAATKCWYVHQGKPCPQAANCKFSHSREEALFNPDTFRTSACAGACGGNVHCPRAHSTAELAKQSDTDAAGFAYGSDDILVLLMYYKTEKCSRKPCTRTCERFHAPKERRRSPLEFDYSEHPCPSVRTGGKAGWGDPSRCKDKDSCRFTHTLLEQMYHPLIYKSEKCNKWDETKSEKDGCPWGSLCTHSHGEKDVARLKAALQRLSDLKERRAGRVPAPPKKPEPNVENPPVVEVVSAKLKKRKGKKQVQDPLKPSSIGASKATPVDSTAKHLEVSAEESKTPAESPSFLKAFSAPSSKTAVDVQPISIDPVAPSGSNSGGFRSLAQGTGFRTIGRPTSLDAPSRSSPAARTVSTPSLVGMMFSSTHDRQLWQTPNTGGADDEWGPRIGSPQSLDTVFSPSAVTTSNRSSTSEIDQEVDIARMKHRAMCPICGERYRSRVIVDCGHSLCDSCSLKAVEWKSCNECKHSISQVLDLRF